MLCQLRTVPTHVFTLISGLSVRLSVCVFVTTASRANTTDPIEMPMGRGQTRLSSRNHALDEGHIGATSRIRRIDRCGGGDAGCRYHYCGDLSIFEGVEHSSFVGNNHFSSLSCLIFCTVYR